MENAKKCCRRPGPIQRRGKLTMRLSTASKASLSVARSICIVKTFTWYNAVNCVRIVHSWFVCIWIFSITISSSFHPYSWLAGRIALAVHSATDRIQGVCTEYWYTKSKPRSISISTKKEALLFPVRPYGTRCHWPFVTHRCHCLSSVLA